MTKSLLLAVILLTYIPSYSIDKNEYISSVRSSNIKKRNARITIQLSDKNLTDKFYVLLWEDHFAIRLEQINPTKKKIMPKILKDGTLIFEISPLQTWAYFSLLCTNNDVATELSTTILKYYMLEPGDDIKIKINKVHPIRTVTKTINRQTGWIVDGVEFLGEGSGKLSARYEIEQYANSLPSRIDLLDSVTSLKHIYLKRYENRMSKIAYDISIADIAGYAITKKCRYFEMANIANRFSSRSNKDSIKKNQIDLDSLYDKLFDSIWKPSDPEVAIRSIYYFDALYKLLLVKKILNPEIELPSYIGEIYSGTLREKMLTTYIMSSYTYGANTIGEENEIQIVNATISHPRYKIILNEYANTLVKGANAYNFTLPDKNGKNHQLSDYKGKVVFLDFWFTRCGICNQYFKNVVSKVEEQFRADTNIVFITISVDINKQEWIEGIKSGEFTSENAINLFTSGKGKDHEVVNQYKVTGYPRPIIIDPMGRIYETNIHVLRDKSKLIKSITSASKYIRNEFH